jgi:hypothetical protein
MTPDNPRDAALAMIDHGYDVTLLAAGTKKPWRKGWNESPVQRAEVDYWMRRYPLNYGALLRGLVVLDRDGRSKATMAFWKEHKITSPLEVRTKRGMHAYFRLPDTVREVRSRMKWLGLGLDVKLTGCVVGVGSTIAETGWTYRLKARKCLVPKADLPPLPDSLVALLNAEKLEPARAMPSFGSPGVARGPVRQPEAYCLRIESHQGANGSAGLVRAVCVLRDAGRSVHEALEFLTREWNVPPRVTPPWSEAEVAYAVRRHFHERG